MTPIGYFVLYEAVHPADHDLIFSDFLNISKNAEITQTKYLYTLRMVECKHNIRQLTFV